MHRVVITDFIDDDLAPERAGLDGLATVEALDGYCEDDLAGRIETADAIMMYHNLSLTRRTIERLDRCRLIVRCGAGIDNVDHAFARTRGITVANVPDYGTEEVARQRGPFARSRLACSWVATDSSDASGCTARSDADSPSA